MSVSFLGSNPNTETSLETEFDKFSHPVVYPDMATIEKFAEYTDKMAENPKIRRRVSLVIPLVLFLS